MATRRAELAEAFEADGPAAQRAGAGHERRPSGSDTASETAAGVNEVRLVGRVSGPPERRVLPSGDEIVQLRVVVPRTPRRTMRTVAAPAARSRAPQVRASVDTVDVTCWSALTRRAAARLERGDLVEVHGALRRRFFRSGALTQSRYDVEVTLLRRLR